MTFQFLEYQMDVGGDLILTKALRPTVFAVSSLFSALVVEIPTVTTIMTHDKVILESIGIATTLWSFFVPRITHVMTTVVPEKGGDTFYKSAVNGGIWSHADRILCLCDSWIRWRRHQMFEANIPGKRESKFTATVRKIREYLSMQFWNDMFQGTNSMEKSSDKMFHTIVQHHSTSGLFFEK